MMILLFLVAGLYAYKTPGAYAKAVKDACGTCDGMILQFPFYAAIMNMLSETGLSTELANWFVNISTAQTLPLNAFYAAGLINLFIPSGGGLWAIQGPIMLEAAKNLAADPAAVMIGMGWGDSWTSQLQPFWACRFWQLPDSTLTISWAIASSYWYGPVLLSPQHYYCYKSL